MEKMTKEKGGSSIPDEIVINKIYLIRGQKVMLDKDLAELYAVETKALKRAVKRNMDIFPVHFMFELKDGEFENLRSQIGTTSWGGSRYLPMAFSEYGILQLANVLRSQRARQMSIRIIEVFVKLKRMLMDNSELRLAIERLEKKTDNNAKNIEIVFKYFDELSNPNSESKKREQIGYKQSRK